LNAVEQGPRELGFGEVIVVPAQAPRT